MKLPVLSYSSVTCFQSCQRLYKYLYVERRPSPKSPAMGLGTEFHAAIEKWTPGVAPNLEGLSPACRGLMRAYHADRSTRNFVPQSHEIKFETSGFKGYIDCIGTLDGKLIAVERKTTSMDLGTFCTMKRFDFQPTLYYAAARACGYDIDAIVLDVLQVPRRNKGDTDSTYEERCAKTNTRFEVLWKTEADVEAMDKDLTVVMMNMETAYDTNSWPRSPGNCYKYNRMCDFFGECMNG